ncbi:MAG: hypothetical protein GX608_08080 [Lentisphaerae bacterium]|nr:hypothetical protein [Lentisphaerota bacterium]
MMNRLMAVDSLSRMSGFIPCNSTGRTKMRLFSKSLALALGLICGSLKASAADVSTLEDLQNMKSALSGRYVLINDIDVSPTTNWNELVDAGAWDDGTDYARIEPVSHARVTHNGTNYYALQNSGPSSTPVEPGVTAGWASFWQATSLPAGHKLGFEPIGSSSSLFTGDFDGKGYSLTGILYISRSNQYVGLFGNASSGSGISNLTVVSVDISSHGENWAGAIAGRAYGTIRNVTVLGGTVRGNNRCGGFAGQIEKLVENCRSGADMDRSVTGEAGVFVGRNTGTIRHCLAHGQRVGNGGGGFVGLVSGTTWAEYNNYFDSDQAGTTTTQGSATPKTTVELHDINTYIDLKTLGLGQKKTGTASADAAGDAVVGVGTLFTTEYEAGDSIRLGSGATAEIRTIESITDDLNLTVSAAFDAAHSGMEVFKVAESDKWDMAPWPVYGRSDYPFLTGAASPLWHIYGPASGTICVFR